MALVPIQLVYCKKWFIFYRPLTQRVSYGGIKKLKGVPELYRQSIEEEFDSRTLDYIRKLEVIKNSIFGVDIQPIAVDVSRLRCFLTLVVEDQIDDSKRNRGVKALPNLDFKFVCADTLTPVPEQISSEIDKLFDNDFQEKLATIVDKYFSSTGEEKTKAEKEIRKLIAGKVAEKRRHLENFAPNGGNEKLKSVSAKINKKQVNKHSEILSLWKSYENIFENKKVDFFDPRYFFPSVNDGFDIVIGNPPYVQLQKNAGELADLYKDLGYATFERTGDIYTLFYERGLNLTKPESGLLCYITSSRWMRSVYGKKLREFFSQRNPIQVIDLSGVKVFESAAVETNIILINNDSNNNKLLACSLGEDYNVKESLADYFDKNSVPLKDLGDMTWFIGSEIEVTLKNKIEVTGRPIKDSDIDIFRGITTGLNEAFVIDKSKKDELVQLEPRSSEIIKPVLKGRDISKYSHGEIEYFLINSHNGYTSSDGKETPPIDINNYPAIKEHLDSFSPKLEERDDQGVTPYNLRNCAFMEDFEKEKIVWRDLVDDGSFSLVEPGIYAINSTFFMTAKYPKYLVGLMNSRLINWYFDKICAESVFGTNRWIKIYIELIPLPPADTQFRNEIASLVEKIINQKNSDQNTDTSEIESRIDEIVMRLYNLSEKEKGLIRRH